jgi:hypothetical protein
MSQNNPAADNINYVNLSGVDSADFDEYLFEDVEDGDLFWFNESTNPNGNHAFRKINESEAQDTKTRRGMYGIKPRLTVYQKI